MIEENRFKRYHGGDRLKGGDQTIGHRGSLRLHERFKVATPEDHTLERYVLFYNSRDVYHTPDQFDPIDGRSVFGNDRSLTLDLGCGRGEFLIAAAKANTGTNHIGVEWHVNSIYKGIHNIADQSLTNIKFISADIRIFLSLFRSDSVNNISINFPPPISHPKKKKNDFVNEQVIEQCRRILKPGGSIDFLTDNLAYFEEKKQLLSTTMRLVESSCDIEEGSLTRYQKLWQEKALPTNRLRVSKS